MQAHILGIQFRKKPETALLEQASITRELGEAVTVGFVSALDATLDWQYPETIMQAYHGVILGGSGDFDFDGGRPDDDEAKRISYEFLGRLRPLFSYLFEHDIPTLGICYGHQLLGAFAGAQVVNDHEQKKSRSHEVRLLSEHNDHFLFTGVPQRFFAHYGHKDSLDRVPEGAVLLAEGGSECKVSALRYKNNIYTTQFHPELTVADMYERMKYSPGYLPEGAVIEELFKDDTHSNRVLHNFGRLVADRVRELQQMQHTV
jgi:GMP synthase (glutamine-hydrolysing)